MKNKIILAVMVGLFGLSILVIGYLNEEGKQETVEISNTTTQTSDITTTSTTTTTTTKTTKKVVKTTKKKATKNKKSTLNVKYNSKNEIIEYTHSEVLRRWGAGEWEATYNIVIHESGWNPNSWNKKSTACGIFQAKPCTKTVKNGYKDYYTNWKTQVNWGLDYIMYKYKTPSNAWKYWKKYHSY